ncbi:MAG: GNAT family N-acetyltransferase [Candidatus Gracilibacteria bacterium]|nr:GNAT family N-acetyltransferase [Candidatus Gracilibacteria bacterium]
MELKSYKKASEIPKKYLASLVDAEIECWGSRPFDEYKICTNPNCKAIFSIEDIYETVANYINRINDELAKNFKCSCCNSKTELIYEKNKFLEIIKEYIKGEVSRVLLIDDNERVEGFGVLSKTNLSGAINYEFATRPASYDKEELLKSLSKELFGTEDAGEEQISLLHQIYVSHLYRGTGFGKQILNSILEFNGNDNIPILLETRYDSEFYPISKTLGFKNIMNDKYGYTCQYIPKKDYFILANKPTILKEISAKFSFYKKEALEILSLNNSFLTQKFYISN